MKRIIFLLCAILAVSSVYLLVSVVTEGQAVMAQAASPDSKISAIMSKMARDLTREDLVAMESYLKEKIKTSPGAAQAVDYSNLGVTCYRLGKYEEALANFKQTAALEPNSPRLNLLLGIAYKALGRQDEAREAFIKWTSMLLDQANTDEEYYKAWVLQEAIK